MRILKPCPYCGQPTYRPMHLAEHVAEERDISFATAMQRVSMLVDKNYIVECASCPYFVATAGDKAEQDAHNVAHKHAHETDHDDVTVYDSREYLKRLGN